MIAIKGRAGGEAVAGKVPGRRVEARLQAGLLLGCQRVRTWAGRVEVLVR